MKALSVRERRLVAGGLAVAAVTLAWLGLVQPVVSGFADRAEARERLAGQFRQNERLISRTAALRRAAEAQARATRDFALAAPDAAQAAELLKTRLADTLTATGGELRATDDGASETGWVRAGVSGVVSYPQLVTLLERLGSEKPYLVIEAVSVSADRAIGSNRLDLMDVQIEASVSLSAPHRR